MSSLYVRGWSMASIMINDYFMPIRLSSHKIIGFIRKSSGHERVAVKTLSLLTFKKIKL